MLLFIITYTHRFGTDVWPHFSTEAPSTAQIIAQLRETGEWGDGEDGEDREDEFIDVSGPFSIPSGVLTSPARE
jgi:hypothetical protein